MFHHILIGYDGSANGKKALEYGIDFAMHAQAHVTIVTAFPPMPEVPDAAQDSSLMAKVTTEAQRLAEMAAEQARACNIEQVQVEVLEGPPAEGILRVAENRGCDCIVVGARGRGGMVGLLLGSVSDRLARHAKVPVLIVK